MSGNRFVNDPTALIREIDQLRAELAAQKLEIEQLQRIKGKHVIEQMRAEFAMELAELHHFRETFEPLVQRIIEAMDDHERMQALLAEMANKKKKKG